MATRPPRPDKNKTLRPVMDVAWHQSWFELDTNDDLMPREDLTQLTNSNGCFERSNATDIQPAGDRGYDDPYWEDQKARLMPRA